MSERTRIYWPQFAEKDGRQAGERRLLDFLDARLPKDYLLIPGGEYPSVIDGVPRFWEYDLVVVTPHAVYAIENKDWSGELYSDNNGVWVHRGERKPNALRTIQKKAAILSGFLKGCVPAPKSVWVEGVVTLSNPRQSLQGFGSAECKRVFTLGDALVSFLTDPAQLGGQWSRSHTPNCLLLRHQKILQRLVFDELPERGEKSEKDILEFSITDVIKDTDGEALHEYIAETQGVVKTKKRVKVFELNKGTLDAEARRVRDDRIRNQSYALAKIKSHPNIFPTEFRQPDGGDLFFEISDYLENATLDEAVKKDGELTQAEKLEVLFGVLDGLQAAHEAGVVHRAIRPENIVYSRDLARIANFTDAWFAEHLTEGYTMPRGGAVSPYDAPELSGGGTPTASCDIYSFGVLANWLYLGTPPSGSFLELQATGGRLPPEKLPHALNANLPEWLDKVVGDAVVLDPAARWKSAKEIRDYIRGEISASVTPGAKEAKRETTRRSSHDPAVGEAISPDLTLTDELGKGGFASVFKAHHALQGRDYAAKIYNESASVESLTAEYNALVAAQHPNIVKFVYSGRTVGGRFYTLMEFIDGENLDAFAGRGERRLAPKEVWRVGRDIASALEALQKYAAHPIFHRDVKPKNIMRAADGSFKLIDFNTAAEAGARDLTGTLPYLPPDLVRDGQTVDWNLSADPFALGVTLYELACRRYPWAIADDMPTMPRTDSPPVDPREAEPRLSEAFAAFLLKAVSTDAATRFPDAQAMREALDAIGEEGVLAAPSAPPPSDVEQDVDTADFVKYLNSLYSQSKRGNAGTRSRRKVNPLDAATYVETRLDTRLVPDIAAGRYRLVIVTGNAGDGKTAFLKNIERGAENVRRLDHGNGARFTLGGVVFESNYDGSQDQGGTVNVDVLRDFFREFRGVADYSRASEGRIIAINEGKLADFLEKEPELANLRDAIDGYFQEGGKGELPKGLMIVNLNLRDVTAREESGASIFRRQLAAFTQGRFWTKCAACPCGATCPIRHNVETFSDLDAGAETAGRLEWLLRMASLRRELHVTVRDMRSFLAFLLTGDGTCAEMKKIAARTEARRRRLYFNAVGADGEKSGDRFVSLVRETDPASVAIPAVDRDLCFLALDPKRHLSFPARTFDDLADFNADDKSAFDAEKLKERHRMLLRRHYFEGLFPADAEGKPGFLARLPYKFLWDFTRAASAKEQAEHERIAHSLGVAVSRSEGCRTDRFGGEILLAASRSKDPNARTYRRFSAEAFELVGINAGRLGDYVERECSDIAFRDRGDTRLKLEVSLDLFEMLKAIGDGFTPSVNDLRGRFVNLGVFKTMLENRRCEEMLVTHDDLHFCRIALDPVTNKISIARLGEED